MKYYLRELKAQNVQSHWDTNRTNIMLEDMYIERVYDEHELVVGYNTHEYEKDLDDEIYRELLNQLSKELLKYVRVDKMMGVVDYFPSNQFRVSLSLLSEEERQIYKSEIEELKNGSTCSKKIDELETYIDDQDEHIDELEAEIDDYDRETNHQYKLLQKMYSISNISIAFNILLLGLLIISFL